MIRQIIKKFYNTTLKKKLIILMAGLVTITPIVLIAMLASVYYYLGIESLFNEKISKVVSETAHIANLYLEEHKSSIKSDAMAVASDIDRNYYTLMEEPELFTVLLDKMSTLRNLSEAIIFTNAGIIAKTSFSFSLMFDKIPKASLVEANNGDVVILKSNVEDRVRAIFKLSWFPQDTYLLVGRYIDPEIIHHVEETKGSITQYKLLQEDIKSTQLKLEIAFIVLSLFLCALAFFIAVKIANLISKPIYKLVEATQMIKAGNFTITLPEKEAKDEISVLVKAFNSMTATISGQRTELINANHIIDERRRFIEAVLSGLSAGVVTIDKNFKIRLFNASAISLLKITTDFIGNIKSFWPEISELLDSFIVGNHSVMSQYMLINRAHSNIQLFVRISSFIDEIGKLDNIIIIFDDVTTLLSAQRSAAWSDVARRIAHEIKNPLTPITLSIERLRKKYKPYVPVEDLNFDKYIDTITKHVEIIERIVREFVQFAKIPEPQIFSNDICEILSDVVFIAKQVNGKTISYNINSALEHCYVECDKMQISQVLTNLIKNAIESIENNDADKQGIINVTLTLDQSRSYAVIAVEDNGHGIPQDIIDKITEPYITTKPKGSGLGLSIVKKIIEDHGGKLVVENLVQGGARASFNLKIS